ncbi:lipocalin-like domain-containing protein [Dyadobacter sp. NIV53]|uniref:lipocalin-like domain-containing protein n=1 Tax=Dyadobacter sp. NIV53 TaxID=2861765 RepID=UPI001C871CDA|nr:lipocalin-like domain-containing protein [Dyadobacter sp. NIV53]
MKTIFQFVILATIAISCVQKTEENSTKKTSLPIVGTWKLITGTTIEKGDTVVAYYNKNVSFVKIINDTHFAFLNHDLKKGKDYSVMYSSGGGTYSLSDSLYTEHLEYCSDREWEGNDFKFTIAIKDDTLIQTGVEKVESAGINRLNIEKYVRLKK